MLSELQRRKLTRRFELYDVSANGVLEQDDFALAAQRVARAFNRAPGMPGYRNVRDRYLQHWEQLQAEMDTDGDGRITLDEYLTAMHYQIIDNPTGFEGLIRLTTRAILEMADANRDGRLSAEEFIQMLRAFSVAETDAAETFQRLDRDKNGYLTGEEIEEAFEEFYRSTDADASGNWLFGPF